MHNFVLSPIDPEKLISSISERVTENILPVIIRLIPTAGHEYTPPDKIYTVRGAAEFLGLTEGTVYVLHSQGKLAAHKAPGSKRLYFTHADLMEYIKSGRKRSNAEIEAQAEAYLLTKKKGPNNGK